MPGKLGPDSLLLQHGDDRLVLDPQHGGAIREYLSGGRPVLRPGTPEAGADPFAMASFPLVPYANRIAGGRFVSGGREVRLSPNWVRDPHPIHGQGWRRSWEVTDASASAAALQLLGGGDEWPWPYRAEQHFRLASQSLSIALSIENLSSEPMPAVLGLHPYFPDQAHARITARTPQVWTVDEGALPLRQVPSPPGWAFEPGRPAAGQPLDHCFAGWDGVAVLAWPDRTLTMRASGCSFLHVYVPATDDFFCIEPQTAATGAFNRGEHEAHLVQPGQRLSIEVSLTLGAS